MPAELFLDLNDHDLNKLVVDIEGIEAVNPQRGEMRQLDGIIWMNEGMSEAIGVKHVGDDEFWCPLHIPGRPLFPGVLMIEGAAQFAGYLTKRRMPHAEFIGFVGADNIRFRGQVLPGSTLYFIGKEVKFSRRRCICDVQGVVDGKLVFEGQITGMPI
ncbi:MAG: beta-hydroxyacyl-ACP dehydratase [Phycisphaera sp.]|nr:beta-hydroxyacyl-ACP dehydratase [Phycisphaera sp.]